jgi:hypothetical protein
VCCIFLRHILLRVVGSYIHVWQICFITDTTYHRNNQNVSEPPHGVVVELWRHNFTNQGSNPGANIYTVGVTLAVFL